MPVVNGYEFLKKIRTSGFFTDIFNIIMVSAETCPEQIEAVFRYNVDAYGKKPYTAEELVAVVHRVLSKEKLDYAV